MEQGFKKPCGFSFLFSSSPASKSRSECNMDAAKSVGVLPKGTRRTDKASVAVQVSVRPGFAHPMIGAGGFEDHCVLLSPNRSLSSRSKVNGEIRPHGVSRIMRAKPKPELFVRRAPSGVELSLLNAIVMVSRGDVRISSSSSDTAKDISAEVVREWYRVAFQIATTGEKDSALRRMEQLAGPHGCGWRLFRPEKPRSLFRGARTELQWFSLDPRVSIRLLRAVIALAGHVPTPLTIRTRLGKDRRLALPRITGAQADQVEELIGARLCGVEGF